MIIIISKQTLLKSLIKLVKICVLQTAVKTKYGKVLMMVLDIHVYNIIVFISNPRTTNGSSQTI